MIESEVKQYFLPGDSVTIRQNIANKPEMYILKKIKNTIRTNIDKENKNDYFQGFLCRWFTKEGCIQEAVYNTKDLKKI